MGFVITADVLGRRWYSGSALFTSRDFAYVFKCRDDADGILENLLRTDYNWRHVYENPQVEEYDSPIQTPR